MICGSVMASFCVEDFSLDRLKTLTAAQLKERFRAFHELSQFEKLDL
jgi:hypothetical protein